MKRILRSMALGFLLAGAGFWLAGGAHRGWTKTSVPVTIKDEVTGIEGVSYQKKFVPGVDFLGGAVLAAGVLAAASFLFRGKKIENQQPTQI
jgi:hypothetical protein